MTSPYLLPDGNVQIAFSGGRSSAFMLHQILAANGDLRDHVEVTFQNTGREMPQTLDFVAEVGRRWGVLITWLEYRPVKPFFEIIGRQGAAVNGEPFEALIEKRKFLPNVAARFCTIELKVRTAQRYLRSIGWDYWTNCLGLRADEPSRLNKPKPKPKPKERWTVWHPLADAGVTKRDVQDFWKKQPFDLELPNINGACPLGNCDGCFLKSEANLAALAREFPGRHEWWESMEHKASELTSGSAATWSKRYSRKAMREFVERQSNLDLSETGQFCQSNEGECFA